MPLLYTLYLNALSLSQLLFAKCDECFGSSKSESCLCLGKCRISLKDNNCYRKKIKVLVLFTALKDVILTKFCLLLTAFVVFFQKCTRSKMWYGVILQKLFLFNSNCDTTMSLIVRTTEIVLCWFPFSVEGH